VTTCGKDMPGFFAGGRVDTVCRRPEGHDGECYPGLLHGDTEGGASGAVADQQPPEGPGAAPGYPETLKSPAVDREGGQ